MSVKLIAFDMDGTLLDHDHVTIPEKNIAALRAARERGIKIVAATGRSWSLLAPVVGPMGGVDYALTSNGSAVLEPAASRWLYTRPIPNNESLELIRLLKGWQVPFEIYIEGQNYMENSSIPLMTEDLLGGPFTRYYGKYTTFVDDLEAVLADRSIEKIDVFYVPPAHWEELCKEIRAILPAQLAHSTPDNLEVTAMGVTKAAALEGLCEELGISSDEVMAFGDGNNDVEMLQWAGLSFAMENGAEDAKAAAKYLAPANHLGGLGEMVQKYALDRT